MSIHENWLGETNKSKPKIELVTIPGVHPRLNFDSLLKIAHKFLLSSFSMGWHFISESIAQSTPFTTQ